MRCPNCGNENPPDYMFCDECGARLTGGDPAANQAEGEDAGGVGATAISSAASAPGIVSIAPTPLDHNSVTSSSSPGSDMDMQSNTTMPATEHDTGGGMDEGDAPVAAPPVTEDTLPYAAPSYNYDTMGSPADSGNNSADADTSLPDVMPAAGSTQEAAMADSSESMPDESVPVGGAEDMGAQAMEADSGAAAPAPATPDTTEATTETAPSASVAAPAGGDSGVWAAEALKHLQGAQQALARGDWGGFGQAMSTLSSALQSAAAGGASGASTSPSSMPSMNPPATAAAPSTSPADSSASMGGWGSSTMTDNGAGTGTSSYTSAGSQPYDSAASDMSGMGAAAAPAYTPTTAEEGAAPAGIPSSIGMPGAEAEGMARLVVISTGAEMSLPEQEEITVGREDPSSGIFPDVDLTPYGGEDGGVSRRHARLLHIGDDYFVEDLQSTNYTKLDGQRLPAHVRERLEDGARLDFGRVAVIFRRS